MDDDTNEGILDQEQGIRLIVKSFISQTHLSRIFTGDSFY